VPILGKRSVKFDAILVCRKRQETAARLIEDPVTLVEQIRLGTQPMTDMLAEVTALSEADRRSLSQAVVAMWYTQGRTRLLPSSLTVGESV